MKVGIAVAVAAATLIGVVGALSLRGSGSTNLDTVADREASVTPPPAGNGNPAATNTGARAPVAPAVGGGPGTALPIAPLTHPTADDVQRILAGVTAEIMAPPGATASTTPLTKEQVEEQVRSKLRELGISF